MIKTIHLTTTLMFLGSLFLAAEGGPAFDAIAVHRTSIVRERRLTPDSFRMQGSLSAFVGFAYKRQDFEITGGPDWVYSPQELFDLEAKASTASSEEVMRVMLQSALRERFHLRVHTEQRPTRVYHLEVAKKGARLTPAAPDTPHDGRGAMQKDKSGITGRGVSTQLIARFVSRSVGRPVLDRTGKTGFYDFDYKSEEVDPGTLAMDLLQSIGLRLSAARESLNILVIDGASRPEDN